MQVHDVLGMHLNRITVAEAAAAPGAPPGQPTKKSYEVDDAGECLRVLHSNAACAAVALLVVVVLLILLPAPVRRIATLPAHPGPTPPKPYLPTDFFWAANGRKQFPQIAQQVEAELSKYKAAVEELNRKTGSHIDPLADPNELMKNNTRNLMSAVSSLPELTGTREPRRGRRLRGCTRAAQPATAGWTWQRASQASTSRHLCPPPGRRAS